MPLNVKRFVVSFFILALFSVAVFSQAEAVKTKLSRARSFVAARNYTAAAIELEDLRRSINDEATQNIANVMLMQVYLETPDYRRAQLLLSEIFDGQKKTKSGLSNSYFAVAGQVIRSSKNQVERYKQLGLSTSDRNLPSEAVADLESMRAMLEAVADQAKNMSSAKKASSEALGLLEDATTARSVLARDEYDAARWRNATADTRESIAGSQTKIFEVDGSTSEPQNTSNPMTNVATNPAVTTVLPPKPTSANLPTQTTSNKKVITKEPPQTLVAVSTVPPINTNPPAEKPKKNEKPKPPEQVIESPVIPQPDTKPETKIEISKSEPKNEPVKVEPKVEPVKLTEVAKSEPVKEDPKPETTPELQAPDASKLPASQIASGDEPNAGSEPPTKPVPNVVAAPPTETSNSDVTLAVGATLLDYATQRVSPTYPQIAKNIGVKGAVTVEVLIDEQGRVASIQKTTGPELLKRAAIDAIKKWKFRPITKDGQPVKFTGFVNFNFAQ